MPAALVAAVLVVATSGCGAGAGGRSSGFDTPAAAGRALIEALNERSADAARALFADTAAVTEAFTCEGVNPLLLMTTSYRYDVERLTRTIPAGTTFEWGGLDEASVQSQVMPAGLSYGSCVVRRQTTLAWAKITFRAGRDKATETQTAGLRLAQLGQDGPWFVVGHQLCALPFCLGRGADLPTWLAGRP